MVVVILRLDRLLVRLRELPLHIGEALKVSARFFLPERGTRHHICNMGGVVRSVTSSRSIT